MSFQQANNIGYGFSQSLLNIFPRPIVSTRAPATTDRAQIGSVWVNTATNNAYILTSIVANVSTWESITGGAGVFSSLTVTPGPVSLTGTTTINTTGAATTSIGSVTGASGITLRVGTGNFSLDGVAGSTYSIGASTTTGTINIGGTGANTGTITIAGGTGAQTLNIANSTGGKTINIGTAAGANAISIGSSNTTSSVTLTAGTGGITLAAGGDVAVNPGNASTSSATATLNERVGIIQFTGFTTIATGTQAFTITNSNVTTTSAILVTAANTGTNAALMTVTGVVPAAGSMVVTCTNNGIATLNGNVNISFWVMS
jgi:hypothetical protein